MATFLFIVKYLTISVKLCYTMNNNTRNMHKYAGGSMGFRIKDGVSFEDVERFGFVKKSKYNFAEGQHQYFYEKKINRVSYTIFIEVYEDRTIAYGVEFDKRLGFIFNRVKIKKSKIDRIAFRKLIKAGIVEKVVE